MTVELLHWNPERPAVKARLGERFAPKRPLNNFGDLLGPVISHELLRRSGIDTDEQGQADHARPAQDKRPQARLATVGSILHFCRNGDTLWGTGRNGKISDRRHKFTSLDVRAVRDRMSAPTLDPRGDLWDVIGGIAASSLIVGSSLHGIIVAESFGIPARLVLPRTETLFKYEDYYRGTGRRSFTPAPDVRTALSWGGEPLPQYDPAPLIDAFPRELWSS